MNLQMKKSKLLKNNMIGILPFICFENPMMEFEDFYIVSDLALDNIINLSDKIKKNLKQYANNQNEFLKITYKNSQTHTTFVVPKNNTSKKIFNDFLEVVFFYLHKGKPTNFLFSPNSFCKEDFKYIIVDFYGDKLFGQFIIKKKFKFQIKSKFETFIISPIGCENILSPELEKHNYLYQKINLDNQGFSAFWNNVKNQKNIIRAINFYNKAMSCEIFDDERFVWLSSALESFFQIGKVNNKSDEIRKGISNIVCNKNFQILNKDDVIIRLSNLITVVCDYRSSYVHGGERSTDSKELERKLTEYFGKIDFIIALMNLVSILLVPNHDENNRFEPIMNVLFCNQEVYGEVVKIFKDNADSAKEKLNNQSMITLKRFSIVDLPSIKFKPNQIEKCLDNILCILAKFAKENDKNFIAIKIQNKINEIGEKDLEKFKKWNDFFLEWENIFIELPTEFCCSILTFRKLFDLLQYNLTLY